MDRRGGEFGEGRWRWRRRERVVVGSDDGVRILDFAVGVVAEGGAGVLQGHGVGRVRRREGVTGHHGVLHVLPPLLAAHHSLFVLDLRVRTSH